MKWSGGALEEVTAGHGTNSIGCSDEYEIQTLGQSGKHCLLYAEIGWQPEKSKQNYTSHEVSFVKKPDSSHFHTFWGKAYVFRLQHFWEGKIDSRAKEGILFWYCRWDAFRILMNHRTKVVELEDVWFDKRSNPTGAQRNENLFQLDVSDDDILFDDL